MPRAHGSCIRLAAAALLLSGSSLAEPALATSVAASAVAPAPRATAADLLARGYVPKDRVPGRALLQLRGVDARRLEIAKPGDPAATLLKDIGARQGVQISLIRRVALGWAFVELRDPARPDEVPSEEETLRLLELVADDPAIEAVTDDRWYRKLATPNDPGLDQMWHLDVIGAGAAWDLTQGLSSQRIGVVDTGLVRAHEDVGQRAVGGWDFVTQNGNDGNGRDADYDDPGDACAQLGENEASYHGTHVAGTIGAATNNGKGISGLNWNAGLVIARVLGPCGGDLVDIMEASLWLAGAADVPNVPAIGANKVSVMNLSLGGEAACSTYEQQVVDFINQQGVVFVAAAGNNGGAVGSPANCTQVVTVAAHGPGASRPLTAYSSFGGTVEIVAPGGDRSQGQGGGVLSALGAPSSYGFYEGTSMAAPHVAGAISLMQALDPSLTRPEIVALLQQNGTTCSGCGGVPALVLDATLQATAAAGDPGQAPPDPDPVDPGTGIAGEDPLEQNDDFAAAAPVSCGDTLDLFAAADDFDWFALTPVAGQAISVSIAAVDPADDLDLYVTVGGTLPDDIVARSESTTGQESIDGTGDGSTLGVLVVPYRNPNTGVAAEGAYRLTVECTLVGGGDPGVDDEEPGVDDGQDDADGQEPVAPIDGDDEAEPNNSADEAAALYCGEEKTLRAADEDWFAVQVRDLDDLVVNARGGGPVAIEILAGNGRVLASAADDGSAKATFLAAGSYLVRVTPEDGPADYDLEVECLPRARPADVEGGCSSTSTAGFAPILALCGLLFARRRRR